MRQEPIPTPGSRSSAVEFADQTFPFAEWLLVLLSFAIFATVRSPVPGVNEPHYLTKARHYWNPAWCRRDPFLQSVDAHLVFYATVGLLTRFCSLERTAWMGRILGWAILSAGWTVLAGRLLPFRWGAVWSAWIFLLLASLGNWSGEWVVGGIEAKVLSYGCGWLSLACALSGQPIRAAAWSGAAVSFHPVVGIWNTVAVVFALLMTDWRIVRVLRQTNWKEWLLSGLAWTALAAPGLIPAVLLLRGADAGRSYQADYIQVFYRLKHHLDPWHFSLLGDCGYVVLIGVSLALYLKLGRSARGNLAARYVLAAIAIAVNGIIIRAIPEMARWLMESNLIPSLRGSLQPWAECRPRLAGWLKFYPFRLADVAVPWSCAVLLTLAVRRWLIDRESGQFSERLGWIMFGGCLMTSLVLPAIDRNPSRLTAEQYPDWVDACAWLKRETPTDALCFVVDDGWALKWFAERGEYLSHKDCPQDAPGIVAWNDRFKLISKWSQQSFVDGVFSPQEMAELRRLTKVDYLIVRRFGPIDLEPVYRNRNYIVYRLP